MDGVGLGVGDGVIGLGVRDRVGLGVGDGVGLGLGVGLGVGDGVGIGGGDRVSDGVGLGVGLESGSALVTELEPGLQWDWLSYSSFPSYCSQV